MRHACADKDIMLRAHIEVIKLLSPLDLIEIVVQVTLCFNKSTIRLQVNRCVVFYLISRNTAVACLYSKNETFRPPSRGLLLPPSPPAQTPTFLPPPPRPHFSRRCSRRRCLPLSGKAAAPRTLRGGEGDLQPNFASRPSRWRPLGGGRVPRGAHPLGVVVTGRCPTYDAVPTH